MKNTKSSKKAMREFLDLKATTYQNKNNGQVTIFLPRKQLKEMMGSDNFPKTIPIRIFKWRTK